MIKKTLLIAIMAIMSCITLSRTDRESKMLDVLNQYAPIAKEIENIKMGAERHVRQGMSRDPSVRAKYSQKMADGGGFSQVGTYQRTRSLSTQIQPYQNMFNRHKWAYVQRYGRIEYNNFIKSNGYEWGLGIYW